MAARHGVIYSVLIFMQTEQCQDRLRNYCLARFEDLEDRIGCQPTTLPPPVIGSTYVRWGRTTCANNTGAVLVYSGRAVGPSYRDDGGGTNMLCLPDDPQYLNCTVDTVQGHSLLTGAEFHTWVARPEQVSVCMRRRGRGRGGAREGEREREREREEERNRRRREREIVVGE